MLRKFLVLFVVLVGVGIVLADESKGKFKKMEKGTITVVVDGKDKDFKLAKDAKVYDGSTELTGKDRGKFLKGLKDGDNITIVHDKDKSDVKELKK